jgi:hypothetical protein
LLFTSQRGSEDRKGLLMLMLLQLGGRKPEQVLKVNKTTDNKCNNVKAEHVVDCLRRRLDDVSIPEFVMVFSSRSMATK